MEELQNTLALLVAASTKSTLSSASSKPIQDRFEYGVLGEVMAAIATRSQMNPSPEMPTTSGDSIAQGEPRTCEVK